MPTRSLRANVSTREPTSTTVPTISCPGMMGERACGSSPSTTCRSVRQTPQASTFTTNCSGPGCGSPTLTNSSASCGALRTIACISLFAGSSKRMNSLAVDTPAGQHRLALGLEQRMRLADFRRGAAEPRRRCGLGRAVGLDKGRPRAVLRVFRSFVQVEHRREAGVATLEQRTPFGAGPGQKNARQLFAQGRPLLALPLRA